MRRSWVIASALLFWVGCTTSIKVGDDGPGGGGSEAMSSTSTGASDPCDGVACKTPPAPECSSGSTRRVHEPTGTCSAGACNYAHSDIACEHGCANGVCLDPPPLKTVTLAAGGHVNCAVLPDSVQCWGMNQWGALGNNSTTDSHVPVTVVGLSPGVKAIASSDIRDVCVINAAGGVECWGTNNHGALGNNSTVDSPVPVPVTGLDSGIIALDLTDGRGCAVTTAGAVKCWGDNAGGYLGDPSVIEFHAPVQKMGLPPVVAVTMGLYFNCVLTATGGVKCWGTNDVGNLGDNAAEVSSVAPVDVVGLSSGVTAISAGASSACALLATGGVKCWGHPNGLGSGSADISPVPVDPVGLSSGVVAIDMGWSNACALLATGAVKCWGSDIYGQLGNNVSNSFSYVPVDVVGLSGPAVEISSGLDVSCARLVDGKVECWGFNASGQLGNGTTVNSSVPVEVVGL